MSVIIERAAADSSAAVKLIAGLEAELAPIYPVKSRHGYSVQQLLENDVAFYVLYSGSEAAACGGIQLFDDFGELKRMYVQPRFRGQGFALQLLRRLEQHALEAGFTTVRLETGIYQGAAIRLYERAGYREIPPFAGYQPDPLSRFYEKRLTPRSDSTQSDQ